MRYSTSLKYVWGPGAQLHVLLATNHYRFSLQYPDSFSHIMDSNYIEYLHSIVSAIQPINVKCMLLVLQYNHLALACDSARTK